MQKENQNSLWADLKAKSAHLSWDDIVAMYVKTSEQMHETREQIQETSQMQKETARMEMVQYALKNGIIRIK